MLRVRRSLIFLLLLGLLSIASQPAAVAAPSGWTTLDVDGVKARIYRDEWGIPHVFAPTNRALFEAYGYTVAEDRLWQLELDRRAARGTLAEVMRSIAKGGAFISRGDGSGTEKKELALWKEAGVNPSTLNSYGSLFSGSMRTTSRM